MAGRPPELILIVDDDPDSCSLLLAALLSVGLTALIARDGNSALDLLASVTPDLILLDAVMPPPDGFETCRRIKLQPALAHIPVVFMTGLSDTRHVIVGLTAGGVDYVTKPIVLDELLARIRVHLDTARMAQSARSALDAAGRRLIATDHAGRIRWTTPQAAFILGHPSDWESKIADVTARIIMGLAAEHEPRTAKVTLGNKPIDIGYVGAAGTVEYFFRVSEPGTGSEVSMLQDVLGLTPRQSDVLLWISHGKSNRDISEILNISPRTVNKHLEQIFVKLGVENRAAAASTATRLIAIG